MATIAKLAVQIAADSAKLKTSLAKATAQIKNFAKNAVKTLKNISVGLAAGAGAAIAGIIVTVNKYASEIDKLAKTSSKLGITVASLQKLQYQAELTGLGADKFNKAFNKMITVIADADNGLSTATRAFNKLGLDINYIKSLSADQQFYAIAESLKTVSNQTEKIGLAKDIFGAGATGVLNTLNADLQALGAEFDALGIKVTQSQAAMVEAYQDSKTKLGAIFSGFGIQLTAQLAEPFTRLIEFINKAIIEMGGMEAAAKRFASFMLKAIQATLKGVSKLVEAFLKLENVMLRIENLSLAPKIAGEAAGSFVSGSADIGPATQRSFDIDAQIAKNNAKIADNTLLKSLDGLIEKLGEGLGKSLEDGALIKPEHQAAFKKAANDAVIRADADKKAAQSTNSLAVAASNAAKKLDPAKSGAESVNIASSFSKIGGLSSGLSGVSAARGAVNNSNKSLGKIEINMQTDAGKVAGQLFGEPSFIAGIKSVSERQTNQEARAVSI